MHSAFKSPGSILKPSITVPRRVPRRCSSGRLSGLSLAIYSGHLPLHTDRMLQSLSPSLPRCLPHENFAASVAFSNCYIKQTEREREKERERERKREKEVVVLFMDDENFLWVTNHLPRVVNVYILDMIRFSKRGSCFSQLHCPAFSFLSYITCYMYMYYSLRGQDNVTAKF